MSDLASNTAYKLNHRTSRRTSNAYRGANAKSSNKINQWIQEFGLRGSFAETEVNDT